MPEGTIKRITIEGFKSIRHAEVELHPINVLIGANGSGKSNFIGVFELLNAIIEKRLQTYSVQRGADSLLYFGKETTSQITISIHFSNDLSLGNANKQGYFITLIPTDDNALAIAHEKYGVFGGGVTQSKGFEETYLGRIAYGNENGEIDNLQPLIELLQSWRIYHFHDTTRTAAIKYPGDLHDNRYLRADGSNLAAFLYLLKERYPEYYSRIVKTVRLIAPFFDDFVLKPLELAPERIRLEWREQNSDELFTAHQLSDGTLRFICLTTLLQQPNPPPVIIIDEPELGLHPAAITLLAGMMQSVSPRTQIITTTQSPAFVSQFEPEDILVVSRKLDEMSGRYETIFGERLDTDALANWLEEYSLGELWEKNVIGGRPSP